MKKFILNAITVFFIIYLAWLTISTLEVGLTNTLPNHNYCPLNFWVIFAE